MTKVPDEVQGAGQKQLKPDMLGGADVIAVTIATAEFKKGQFGMKTHLTFVEHEGVELRVGKRGTDRLVEKFGDDSDEWIDQKIPLVKGREEVGNKSYVVYQVPPIEEWTELLAQAKRATKGRKSA